MAGASTYAVVPNSRSHWRRGRIVVVLLSVLSLVAAGLTFAPSASATTASTAAHPAAAPTPGDFGAGAEKSADVAVNGWGDTTGYHLELGHESSGFAGARSRYYTRTAMTSHRGPVTSAC